MDYEEKYKSALKWMQSLYGGLHGATKEEAEKYFPELKETKDERIRKTLIEFFGKGAEHNCTTNGISDKDILTWLKKQSEPEDKGEISDGYHTFNELYRYRMLYNAAFFNLLPKHMVHKSKKHHDGKECFDGGWFIVMANLPTGQISNHYELKDWDLFQIPEKEIADEWDGHTPQEAAERLHKYLLEKQGEQKPYGQRKECEDCQFNYAGECKGYCALKRNEQPTDKVEPKFKVGDWLQYRYAEPFLVEEITEQGYCNGDCCLPFEWEDEIHLWDIQDAEDGDVLVDVYGNIGIFKKCYDFDWISYCSLGNNGGFQVFTVEHENEKTYPATKEQCKLLFQKMKEDGWEWDAEKKELKTIEQKSTDNIGSKFKVEDYIVPNNDAFLEIWRIINIDKDGYYNIQCITNSEYDEIYRIPAFVLEKEYHLWTIADAKCGDVLVASDGSLFILSKVVDTAAFHYFSLCKNGSKEIGDGNHAWESVRGCHPATKEERELLYAKMKESGWEWDSEKKELKKTYRTI